MDVMVFSILDTKSTSDPKNILSANYMKLKINEKVLEFPQLCASSTDYKKADKSKLQLTSNIFQYHINLGQGGNIATVERQEQLLKNYEKVQKKHSPILSDVNFWWDGRVWTTKERESALDLQIKMNTDFLSDVISDRDGITLERFETQVNDLLSRKTDKTKCPSISMNTDNERFSEQLQLIHEKNIQRFNVDWTGMTEYQNWTTLSAFLKDRKIWCNMTAINTKRHTVTKKSYVMLAICHGVHTAGLGYPTGFSGQAPAPKSYVLNESTLRYDLVNDNRSYLYDTISHNKLSAKILESQDRIKNDTFYDDFLPQDYV